MNNHTTAAAENTAGPKIADPVDVVTDVPARNKSRAPTASHNSVRSARLVMGTRRVYLTCCRETTSDWSGLAGSF